MNLCIGFAKIDTQTINSGKNNKIQEYWSKTPCVRKNSFHKIIIEKESIKAVLIIKKHSSGLYWA